MNRFSLSVFISIFLISSSLHAKSCKVVYKAKKIQVDRFLFQDIENLKYRSGVLVGSGETDSDCKANALRKVTKHGWTVTYSGLKKTS